jgi:hypothetical protein
MESILKNPHQSVIELEWSVMGILAARGEVNTAFVFDLAQVSPNLADKGRLGKPKPDFAREAEKEIKGSRYDAQDGGTLSFVHPITGEIDYLYGDELIARVARQNKINNNDFRNRMAEEEQAEKEKAEAAAIAEEARTKAFFKQEKEEDKARRDEAQREGRIGRPLYDAVGEGFDAIGGGVTELLDKSGNIIEQGKNKFLESLIGGGL